MDKLSKVATPLLISACISMTVGCTSSSMSKKDRTSSIKFMNCYENKINLVRLRGTASNVNFEDCLDHRMSARSREMKLVIATINNFALTEKQITLASVSSGKRSLAYGRPVISAKSFKNSQNINGRPLLLSEELGNAKTYPYPDKAKASLRSKTQAISNQLKRSKKGSIPLPSLEKILKGDGSNFTNKVNWLYNASSKGRRPRQVVVKKINSQRNLMAQRQRLARQKLKATKKYYVQAKRVAKPAPKRRIVRKAAISHPKVKYARANIQGSYWNNITKGFSLSPHLNKKLVKKFIAYYSKNSKAVTRLSQRAAVFLPMITEEIRNRGMPMEIALLPFVESGFATKAVSSANAAGLWQFIPATGKRYGLKKNSHYDGRFNPDAATTAALDYLQDLHQQFNGDWLLALAAYNAGENRVRRAVAKQMKAGKPIDFWSLSLPKETRLYVPRLLAYRELIRRPDAYNIVLPSDKEFVKLKRLRVAKKLDLKSIAIQAKLPKNDILTRLNPNFTSGRTQPKYERNILVPSVYYERVRMAVHRITKL